MSTELTVATQPMVTPMDLLARANAEAWPIERMEKLMEMQFRWEADQARKAFDEAMATFKANPPEIRRNKHVKHNDFWHATLDEVVAKVTPALAAVGIRHRWNVDQTRAPQIEVTCILSHKLGHTESTPMVVSADTSGSKNAIQAIGSAITYAERYTLLAATGLTAMGIDDDGRSAGPATHAGMAEAELVSWLDSIAAAAELSDLERIFKAAQQEANRAKDKSALLDIVKAKDKRKAELA